MKLEIISKGKDKLKLEVKGESHTFLNLLRETAWKAGAIQASYSIEQPYLSEPKITVKSKNPKKTLVDASEIIINDSKAFQREFKRVGKK